MENNYQMFPKPTTKKSNKIQLKRNLFWRFCYNTVTHACSIHGYFSKIKLFWAQICVTPKKGFKKRNPSILWNSFWELSWKSQQDQPKKIIYGELWLLQQMWAYTLIHLIKFFEWITGYKTRGILKKSNQAITRSLQLLTVNYTNVNPDEQKSPTALTSYDFSIEALTQHLSVVLILNYMASDNTVYHPRFQHAGKITFLFWSCISKKTIIFEGYWWVQSERRKHT